MQHPGNLVQLVHDGLHLGPVPDPDLQADDAKPSSVLREFRPETKVLVLDSAVEMSKIRPIRSLLITSMVVG